VCVYDMYVLYIVHNHTRVRARVPHVNANKESLGRRTNDGTRSVMV